MPPDAPSCAPSGKAIFLALESVVVARRLDLLDISKRNRFEALRADTKVGLTFATVACEAAEGSETRTRNQANARKAYGTVVRLSKKTRLEADQWEAVTKPLI